MSSAFQFDPATGEYIDTSSSSYAVAEISGKNYAKKSDALSVSDALQICKTSLESIHLKVIGEVSSVRNNRAYAGVYFDIKDKGAVLPCVMWNRAYYAQDVEITVGDLVEIIGNFTAYAAKGKLQFNVDSIKLAGEGDLRMQVAALAKKLQKEGLCDAANKIDLPEFPETIGVITSPRGAAIHDVFRTLRRRMPIAKVVSAAVLVEGKGAAAQMIEALDTLEKYGVDLILLVRGGGSFEDLMPFNDETLARRVASCKIPVVTGIGHEPDTTICDLVSDMRASTPTAAAEAASIDSMKLSNELSAKMDSCKNTIINKLNSRKNIINQIAGRPIFVDGSLLYQNEFQNLGYLQDRLVNALSTATDKYKHEISLAASQLNDRSPLVVLSRGYAAAFNDNKKIIKSVDALNAGDNINIALSDGVASCNVTSTKKVENTSKIFEKMPN